VKIIKEKSERREMFDKDENADAGGVSKDRDFQTIGALTPSMSNMSSFTSMVQTEHF